MLQWMGGSRRKVTTSRKSTQKRQKQYFEQRKRQLQQDQASVLESHADGLNACHQNHKKHRSLDILCLLNLSTVAQDLDCHITTCSPVVFDKITPAGLDEFVEAGRKIDDQVWAASPKKIISCAPDGQKNVSTTHGVIPEPSKVAADQELSVLDMLGDYGPDSESGACLPPAPPYEAHVAFSVEGLGKVAAETPVNSPPQLSSSSLPLNSVRRAHASKNNKFVLDDLDLGVATAAQDFCFTPGSRNEYSTCRKDSSPRMNSFSYPIQKLSTFEDCMQLDGSGNKVMTFGDEFFSSKPNNKNGCNARACSMGEQFFNGTDYDRFWNDWSSQADNDRSHKYFEFENHELSDLTWRSSEQQKRYPMDVKNAEELEDHFDIESCIPYSVHRRSKEGHYFPASNMTRFPVVERCGEFKDLTDQPTWSCFMTEDARDSMSLLSEESCSSSAVMGEAAIESPSNSTARESTRRQVNDHGKPSHKYDIENLYAKKTRKKHDSWMPEVHTMSKAVCRQNSTFQKKSEKGDRWLSDEKKVPINAKLGFCPFGQNMDTTSSGRNDDFSVLEQKIDANSSFKGLNILPEECPGHISTQKFAFNESFHASPPSSPIFSDIGPRPTVEAPQSSKMDSIPPEPLLFAAPLGETMFVNLAAQENKSKDRESTSKISATACLTFELENEAGMSHMDTSSETRKPKNGLESENVSHECRKSGDTTSNPKERSSASTPEKFGTTVDGKEYLHGTKLLPPCQDGSIEDAKHGDRALVSARQDESNNPSHQVMMLESYVQLLCVQKVLK